ncbi:uncharacterized protein Z518_00696 [Rhinocladiella mackenziei CBS 650.93]|uniref:Apple domain-containing protein n=1 Tax=Rhinocladiella mackenziei CBS 650.93 TaxID=1442369 RepID=A0A0D2J1Q4_9EURO|nr:uncharacterized protein Z518_00696 [Rhinocladiella mackenziei CBS 650.93]KIX09616.1 hypothetical protein Z518_00696 [Rhinocladiella mackenziei CBS 650.93]
MLPFLYFLLCSNLVSGSLGGWDSFVPWKRNLLERDIDPTCSCTDPAAAEWATNKFFSVAATSAETPAGYTQTLTNGHTWTSGDGYLGYTTIDEYDNGICAAICDSIEECSSFEIYFEKEVGGSTPSIKCAFWAGAITTTDASTGANAVIAGCNGYTNNTLTTPEGFDAPSYIGGAAIHPPGDSNSFMGSKIFEGPFDTSHCAEECHSCGCKFFNTYVVSKNGIRQGQYCDMYAHPFGHDWATETGSSDGKTNYTISHSFTCGWAGDKRDEGKSNGISAVSPTRTASSGGKGNSWEHDHPWHGSGPNTGISTTATATSGHSGDSTAKSGFETTTSEPSSSTETGPGGFPPTYPSTSTESPDSSTTKPEGETTSPVPEHSATHPGPSPHTTPSRSVPSRPSFSSSHGGGDWSDWSATTWSSITSSGDEASPGTSSTVSTTFSAFTSHALHPHPSFSHSKGQNEWTDWSNATTRSSSATSSAQVSPVFTTSSEITSSTHLSTSRHHSTRPGVSSTNHEWQDWGSTTTRSAPSTMLTSSTSSTTSETVDAITTSSPTTSRLATRPSISGSRPTHESGWLDWESTTTESTTSKRLSTTTSNTVDAVTTQSSTTSRSTTRPSMSRSLSHEWADWTATTRSTTTTGRSITPSISIDSTVSTTTSNVVNPATTSLSTSSHMDRLDFDLYFIHIHFEVIYVLVRVSVFYGDNIYNLHFCGLNTTINDRFGSQSMDRLDCYIAIYIYHLGNLDGICIPRGYDIVHFIICGLNSTID